MQQKFAWFRRLVSWPASMFRRTAVGAREQDAPAPPAASEGRDGANAALGADDWYRMSLSYGRERRHEEASEAARRAIALDPKHSRAWRSLSFNLSKLPGKEREGLDAWRCFADMSDDPHTWCRLSVHYGRSGAYDQAVDSAQRAIDLDSSHLGAWRSLAINLAAIPEKKAQALKARWEVAELSQTPDVWSALAADLAASGQYRDAIQAARRAVTLDSGNTRAWRAFAISCDQVGERADSLAAWEMLGTLSGTPIRDQAFEMQRAADQVRLAPGSMQGWKEVALAYGRLKLDREAIELAKETLVAQPAIHNALVPLLEEVLNRVPETASELLRQMLALDADNAHYIHLLGVAEAKSGGGEQAFDRIRESTRRKPNDSRYWYALGRALEDAGVHRDEAISAFETAVTLNPKYSKARLHLDQLRQVL